MVQTTVITSLLTIPPELRDLIFSLVLVADRPLVRTRELYSNKLRGYPTPPPLCRVSKQIRGESLGISYGCNTFHCHLINGSPLRWYQQTLPYHWQGVNHVKRIIVERDSFIPPGSVTKLLLAQDGDGEIKAAYLDESAGFCTCKLEKWASKIPCAPAQSESLRLFSFGNCLARGHRKWMIYPKSRASRRGEVYDCGKVVWTMEH